MTPLDLALSYIAAGVPVFPCRSADEETDQHDEETGEVIVLKAKSPLTSNGFKSATKSERVVRKFWERDPGAMVGIPTGEQINAWVLDVDKKGDASPNGYDTLAALEKIHGALPATAIAKTANGGRHYLFNHVAGLRNRGALGVGLDVRGSGGFIIAAGSRMADGRSYNWVDYDGPGIPPVADAPQWLIDIILPKVAETPEYNPVTIRGSGDNPAYVARAVESELETLACTGHGARNNQLNDSAYALGQFVGAGGLSEYDARDQLEEIAKQWPNFNLSKGTINRGLKAGMANPRTIPTPDHQHTDSESVVRIDFTPLIMNSRAKATAALEPVTEDAEPEDEPSEYKFSSSENLENLTAPGGLVEDLIDWIVSSAEYPNRVLAMAAVLPMVAALVGNRYATTGRSTRSCLYSVALAESGFGKEHARSQIKRLIMESHGLLDKFGGPARIMSASALREVLEVNPSVNCQIDEFGGFVRTITDRNAGSHQQAISVDLRDYYSASSTFFEGAAYRGNPPKKIYNPNLCIHGTSTPDQFWAALSSASAEDGLLPRLVLFLVEGERPDAVKPERDTAWVPGWLLERMCRIAHIDVVAERSASTKLARIVQTQVRAKTYNVPWTDDAKILFESIKAGVAAEEKQMDVVSRPFVRRILENATKLALIVSVGTNPEEPVITEANIEWAATVAWSCAATMISQITDRLADNQREANYKRIAGIIRGVGKDGITMGKLVDRLKSIDARQREEILKDLKESGKVELVEKGTAGRKRSRLVWAA